MNKDINPLTKFYRTAALSVPLPSRGKFYDNNVLVADDELKILPMTAQDEITLQNPDALLNGTAIIDVIKSCVPSILKPQKLLSCDIDVLMIAIRIASYGGDASMDAECPSPKCQKNNTFTLNLETLLNHSEVLDDEYEIILDNELTIFLVPGRFENLIRQQRAAFQNTKLEQAITDPDISDEQRLSIISTVFKQVSKFNFERVHTAIQKIIFTDDDGELVEITNHTHIEGWVRNVGKATIDTLETNIDNINKIGVEKTLNATCIHCEHTWEAAIEFNPVNFS